MFLVIEIDIFFAFLQANFFKVLEHKLFVQFEASQNCFLSKLIDITCLKRINKYLIGVLFVFIPKQYEIHLEFAAKRGMPADSAARSRQIVFDLFSNVLIFNFTRMVSPCITLLYELILQLLYIQNFIIKSPKPQLVHLCLKLIYYHHFHTIS